MMNDNLVSYSFFHAVDPLIVGDYEFGSGVGINASQQVDIYFWGNLKRIDNSFEHNYIENLRYEMIDALSRYKKYRIQRSFLTYDFVFTPFTITPVFKTFLKPPFAAFRISGMLHFNYLVC
jgi:hypothetical protein